MRLLLVEDDQMLGESIVESLTRQGYTVDWLTRGGAVLSTLKTEDFSAVILDLMLPDTDGFQVLKAIRLTKSMIPVMILTARDDIEDRVRGLDSGADDYVVKPFALDEMLARLRVLIRRLSGALDSHILVGSLELDLSAQSIQFEGNRLKLTHHEFKILSTLMSHAGRVMSKEQLVQSVYGWDESGSDNAIEVHIHNVRKKLPKGLIKNIRGIGYIIEKE